MTITTGVTKIEDYAFYSCTNLETITIPEEVTKIGAYTFCECSALINITIPTNLTTIGDNAFYNCVKLSNIVIPGDVTRIGIHAFAGCGLLANVVFNDTSTWYYTANEEYTGGTKINESEFTNSGTNATNLKSNSETWCPNYLYKTE